MYLATITRNDCLGNHREMGLRTRNPISNMWLSRILFLELAGEGDVFCLLLWISPRPALLQSSVPWHDLHILCQRALLLNCIRIQVGMAAGDWKEDDSEIRYSFPWLPPSQCAVDTLTSPPEEEALWAALSLQRLAPAPGPTPCPCPSCPEVDIGSPQLLLSECCCTVCFPKSCSPLLGSSQITQLEDPIDILLGQGGEGSKV